MNFEFAEFLNPKLEKFNFSGALSIAETALKEIPETPFHPIIGRSFVDEADYFAKMVNTFFGMASKEMQVKALYFEFNEFDINPDSWHISSFAFSEDGGLDLEGMDWLCDFEMESDMDYEIAGFEDIQHAFKNTALKSRALMDAYDWCEQIVIIRFMEFIRMAHVKAAEKNYPWAKVPVYFTENGYEFILRSVNE